MHLTRRQVIAGAAVATTGVTGWVLNGPGGAIASGQSRALPIEGNHNLPSQVDCVIIGGGIVGCVAALTLAERGVSVALCEKGVIAGEASGRALGHIEDSYLDPIKLPLTTRSKELWLRMNGRIGADTGYCGGGGVSCLKSDEDVSLAEEWLKSIRGVPSVKASLIDRSALEAFGIKGDIALKGALFNETDAQGDPRFAAPRIARAAQMHGVKVLQQCAVRGVETKGGHVCGVITEHGSIKTSAVILAGGVWSPLFARHLGLDLPQFEAYGSVISIGPTAGPMLGGEGNDIVWRREGDGGYALCFQSGAAPITPTTLRYLPRLIPAMKALWSQLDPVVSLSTFWREARTSSAWSEDSVTPFETMRILQPEVRNKLMDHLLKVSKKTFPSFSGVSERERWAGALMCTLDNMPVISSVSNCPGLYLGTGFYYGFTMGPAGGEALADMVTGQKPQFDLTPYRYDRFADGSPLIFRD
ncbi:FAD-binding oxidoreductase [Acetobacter senegalensis]|uniref:NAD(P)/FAD-dependent oxidoreductase n=1 Tax=Acetobacter senegalensis TaxID=446692 RepID=UPI001EDB8B0A|nr:FAD-binding oxidoreductase [Acetobacter senegalensis]MCG4262436.1 FAD-binding oxidoreductase [Acetobacter senegalensis]